jgi:Ceramidase
MADLTKRGREWLRSRAIGDRVGHAKEWLAVAGKRWDRKWELPLFGRVPWMAEFWNTISNAPFVLIGVTRYVETLYRSPCGRSDAMPTLWLLLAVSGLCSAAHHSLLRSWSLRLDQLPIALSVAYVLLGHTHLLLWVSPTSYLCVALALGVLVADHIWTPIPVPWGHVIWHLMAAFAFSSAYQDMSRFYAC